MTLSFDEKSSNNLNKLESETSSIPLVNKESSLITYSTTNQYLLLAEWFKEHIRPKLGNIVKVNSLYQDYTNICNKVGLPPFNVERWSSFVFLLSAFAFGITVLRTRRAKSLHFIHIEFIPMKEGETN